MGSNPSSGSNVHYIFKNWVNVFIKEYVWTALDRVQEVVNSLNYGYYEFSYGSSNIIKFVENKLYVFPQN